MGLPPSGVRSPRQHNPKPQAMDDKEECYTGRGIGSVKLRLPARIYMFFESSLERMPVLAMFDPTRMLGGPLIDILLVDFFAVVGSADDFVLVCVKGPVSNFVSYEVLSDQTHTFQMFWDIALVALEEGQCAEDAQCWEEDVYEPRSLLAVE
jgi:hypothetical protein